MRITKNNIEDVFKSGFRDMGETIKVGYELVDDLFVDASGFGVGGEPALTKEEFLKVLSEIVEKHKTVYTWITSKGQFQVYVGVYIKINGVY